MVLIKGPAAGVHVGMLFPRFWNHHHDRLADRVARHGQKFQAIVKGGGVGLIGKTDGVELFKVGRQHGGRHDPFAGFHPVVIALDGVDFTVVRHITVGVGQRPFGERVRRETLMHQAQGRHTTSVLQIQIVGAHLIG